MGGGRGTAALVALGLAGAAALAAMAWLPGASGMPVPGLLLWGGAWCAYCAAWARARGTPISVVRWGGPGGGPAAPSVPSSADGSGGAGPRDAESGPAAGRLYARGVRAAVWGVALAARLPLLLRDPHLSDDVYRYLWDGWVSAHGVNPYLHPPAAPALEPLHTAWHALVNHPGIPTIYPPGAQLVFHLLALAGPAAVLYKAAWVAADLGVGWTVDRLARGRGRDGAVALLLWLWSPLVLVEVAWSGHVEPLGVLPMTAALLLLARGERASSRNRSGPGPGSLGAGALLGLGVSVKFAPAVAVPALWRRRGALAALAAVGVAALLYLPYAGAGTALFAGLAEYAARWEFNAGVFGALRWLAGPDLARWAGPGAAAAVAVVAALRRWSVERALFWGLGAALVLSPTVHPWYLLWILPLAVARGRKSWILWSGLVFLAYAGLDVFRATGRWPQPALLRAAVHLPFLALLAAEALGLPSRIAGRRPGRTGGGADHPPGSPAPGREGAREPS